MKGRWLIVVPLLYHFLSFAQEQKLSGFSRQIAVETGAEARAEIPAMTFVVSLLVTPILSQLWPQLWPQPGSITLGAMRFAWLGIDQERKAKKRPVDLPHLTDNFLLVWLNSNFHIFPIHMHGANPDKPFVYH